jgi:hypothetical protein
MFSLKRVSAVSKSKRLRAGHTRRVDRYGQIAFYPSHFRNIIMQAANNLTLMDIHVRWSPQADRTLFARVQTP